MVVGGDGAIHLSKRGLQQLLTLHRIDDGWTHQRRPVPKKTEKRKQEGGESERERRRHPGKNGQLRLAKVRKGDQQEWYAGP